MIHPVWLKSGLVLIALVFALAAAVLVFMFSSAATATGSSPELAISITAGQNTGILGPGQRRWFRVLPNPDGERFQPATLSMVFASADGFPQPAVNFELFTAAEISAWQSGGVSTPANFGAGTVVWRDGAPSLTERIWRGTLLHDGDYYLAVENNSPARIDYWLTNAEAVAPAISEPAAIKGSAVTPTPPPEPAATSGGQSPAAAIALVGPRQTGWLAPGQEAWFSLTVDNTPSHFEEAALTLVMTPDNGQRVGNVGLDIFTAAGVQAWSPQNSAALANVGAGGVVQRDNNPLTGERFWLGWVASGDLYYVRLANGSDAPINYWLFNGDVYQPELGP